MKEKKEIRRVTVNLPLPVFEDLYYYSSYAGMSIGECVREAVRNWVFERMKELRDTDRIRLQLKKTAGGVMDAR